MLGIDITIPHPTSSLVWQTSVTKLDHPSKEPHRKPSSQARSRSWEGIQMTNEDDITCGSRGTVSHRRGSPRTHPPRVVWPCGGVSSTGAALTSSTERTLGRCIGMARCRIGHCSETEVKHTLWIWIIPQNWYWSCSLDLPKIHGIGTWTWPCRALPVQGKLPIRDFLSFYPGHKGPRLYWVLGTWRKRRCVNNWPVCAGVTCQADRALCRCSGCDTSPRSACSGGRGRCPPPAVGTGRTPGTAGRAAWCPSGTPCLHVMEINEENWCSPISRNISLPSCGKIWW